MRTFVVTPPAPVVTWEEAAQHLRLEADDEEQKPLVEAIIAAASAHIDGPAGWLGSSIGVQTLETYYPAFGTCGFIALPHPPLISIVEVEYIDGVGATIILPDTDYTLRGALLRPAFGAKWPLASWEGPHGETVRIRYTAGYETLPAPIRAAILLMVGDLFENRSSTASFSGAGAAVQMSTTVEALLAPFRRFY